MQVNLTGKSVLLGVTGSISAYKACDLARLFVKAGAQVHVVMTPSAERFVSALTFEALTRNPVLTEGTESWSSAINHIDIGKKCDVCIIAPATANTLNKLSHGLADNILTQTILAFTKKILLSPAANTHMLENQFTTQSMKTLATNNYTIIQPQEKLLACRDVGNGALAEPSEIFFETAKALQEEDFWKDRPIIVTGGGSREKIDEVRYISNFSSGKMAKSLCLALYLKGAKIHYITSMDGEGLPSGIHTVHFEDADALLKQTQEAINVAKKENNKEAFLFMVAAVADFKPKFPKKGKLKKTALGEVWDVELTQNPDILSSLDKKDIKTVAFKAEMDSDEGLNNAVKLLAQKRVDAVCYKLLQDAKSFGGDENEITFITEDTQTPLGRADKLTLSYKILDQAKALSHE
ncbi:MAG: bifunctional phosphopantothenoylcysteine decarboxylase/phosphopantothenate--cysteine ligase CoaBC [Sulfurovum sp.]|uniref:bifunctional phosphopantothenoylcysteine decarboxylase/phosphopantothenate--cysteine ligase CoaBC n=1 Tax=Sulfurovum sp. TaxID=1969726 RepID=UPI002867CBE9|nr:bifunctional phosphopantothenoylcysteine decarboxylase/phosphopantothenate--cysteine ligase CoaBC [Sulfurovum sp.]MCO4845768.1 bifunctional phosphopantothenoylcysteine decarboxylase/phosphopantothenate--cysteine ligase CoaBC [Sulfurovum sp.]